MKFGPPTCFKFNYFEPLICFYLPLSQARSQPELRHGEWLLRGMDRIPQPPETQGVVAKHRAARARRVWGGLPALGEFIIF